MTTARTAPSISSPAARRRRTRVLPGFGPALGFTLGYLGLLVIVPLVSLFVRAADTTWPAFVQSVTNPRVMAAYRLTVGASLVAACVNAIFGFIVAWVLTRYTFPGRRIVDALVDLPFAMPTAVAGIALTAIYAPNGWIGRYLEPLDVRVAFTRIGVVVALTFIGLPFVVRTVQPVLQDLGSDVEEAAASLGASRWATFRRVVLPAVTPALLTGFTLAFARALGEYGSVIFISGNLPLKTEIATLLVMTKLEQYDYAGATAVAGVLLAVSFALLLAINLLQAWSRRGQAPAGAA